MGKENKQQRNKELAMIHMAGRTLFGNVSRGGAGREDYEGWLVQKTGKASSAALDGRERRELIAELRASGLIPDRPRQGIGQTRGGQDRPTAKQWSKMAALALDMGWEGIEDGRFIAFVLRTAKVSSPRFLSRNQASMVIMGLENWLAQKERCNALSTMP